MARKRKRGQSSTHLSETPSKRHRIDLNSAEKSQFKCPTLHLYYVQILTLRNHLLAKLPPTSKIRRRRIASADDPMFDRTLVCVRDVGKESPDLFRSRDFAAFSQRISLTAGSSGGARSSQSELIDFTIWRLFNRTHCHNHRPPHMLCHGYQRINNLRHPDEDQCAIAGIPGLVSYYPNSNVDLLKGAAWTGVLSLLGKEGDQIMLEVLLDCGLFVAIDEGQGNYYQLSGVTGSKNLEVKAHNILGTPLTELTPLVSSDPLTLPHELKQADSAVSNTHVLHSISRETVNSSSAISFVRNRMFYARAALNTKGRVTFGLRHIRKFREYATFLS